MSELEIKAESRSEFGKGAARPTPPPGLVPAVLYGHGTDPVHITLPGHELMMALKTSNALLTVNLGDKTELALPKQVQRHPIRNTIEHVDLLMVRHGEKVSVDVRVQLVGEADSGTLVSVEHPRVTIEVEATDIPEHIVVSIEGAEIGTQVHASDLVLPAGAALAGDPGMLVVNISAAPTAEQMEAQLTEAVEGEEVEPDETEAAGEPAGDFADD